MSAAGERFAAGAARRIGVGVTLAAAVLVVVLAAGLSPAILVALPGAVPGIAEVRSQPDEPGATLRRLADASGLEPPA